MARRTRSAGRSAPPRASSRTRAAPSRSAMSTSRASRPPAPQSSAPAPQKKQSAAPPAQPQQPQGSAMGGFMANVASTGLGVMAGRAMDRAFFGGGSAAPAEELPPQQLSDAQESWETTDPIPESICSREALEFKKCMERNSSDVASCQWNLDILAACQRQSQEVGFADAGRL